MTRGSLRGTAVVSLLVMSVIGGWLVAPSVAHDNDRISHNWGRHYKRLAKKIFYTKRQSNARFINVGEQASNAALLNGLDSTAFASASHVHSGDDITTGTVDETVIDVLIARVADVFDIVLAADGAGSTLDADLLDGLNSAAFAGASHVHGGDDITTGTVADARIDALLARDAEVFGIVTAADGTGSGLDADLLDGQSAAAFAGAAHTHSGSDITSGTVDEGVIDVLIARVADVFDIVLAADGTGSGLDADLLDGQSAAAFAPAGQATTIQWFKEAADGLASTATAERVVFTAPEDITITSVTVEPAAALAASDTNYATITIVRRDGNGSNTATILAETTQTVGAGGTGSWTAFSTVSLGSLANTALTEGQKVTIAISKTGLGVAVPIAAVQIEYTVD